MAMDITKGQRDHSANKTPAPDSVSAIRNPSGIGYGQNFAGNMNPSSIAPGKRVVSPLGANLESSVSDPVLDAVRKGGFSNKVAGFSGQVEADDEQERFRLSAGQTRAVSAEQYPTNPGMKGSAERRQPTKFPGIHGTIPGKLTPSDAMPERQPDAEGQMPDLAKANPFSADSIARSGGRK
jgi:hypothetical protein